MKRAQPVALRMESISRQYLGRPYITNPLIGSAETPEVFTSATRGFDCVTYLETVVARAYARNARDFPAVLRRIRYDAGRVEWKRRNHYMTNWIRNNVRDGLVQRVDIGAVAIAKQRQLSMVPGLSPQNRRFSCVPKRLLAKVVAKIHSGDLIFFASTRSHLDIFHCGIVIRDGKRLLLRHASKSQGGVVEQELPSFLKANRMAGMIFARPAESVKSRSKEVH